MEKNEKIIKLIYKIVDLYADFTVMLMEVLDEIRELVNYEIDRNERTIGGNKEDFESKE